MRFHHVQLACPPGGEDAARRFYVDGLGLVQTPKPLELAGVPQLEAVIARLESWGYAVDRRERHTFPGFERAHVFDPHGNRLELLARAQ